MGWFSKNSKKISIDEEREIKKLNSYAKELMNKPMQFEISEEGFPMCPVCVEEFKDKETIISHLKRRKKEFKELDTLKAPIKIELVLDETNENILRINEFSYLPKGFGQKIDLSFNEDYLSCKKIIEQAIRRAKLFDKITNEKYKDWREGTKKKFRENPISPRKRFEILKRDHYTCQYCGRKAPEVQLEVDHIEPYAKTKNNDSENLITACKDCNRGKRTKEVI